MLPIDEFAGFLPLRFAVLGFRGDKGLRFLSGVEICFLLFYNSYVYMHV